METDRSQPRLPFSRNKLLVLALVFLAATGIAGAKVTFDQDFVTTPQLNPDGQQLDLDGLLNISDNDITDLDDIVFGSGQATVTQDADGQRVLVEGDNAGGNRVNLLELDPDGSPVATVYGNLDLDNSKLTNVGSLDCPIDEVLFGDGNCADVVETAADVSSSFVNVSGDNMSGRLDMNDSRIIGLSDPNGTSSAAINKGWADTEYLARNGSDSMGGDLDMAGNDLLNLGNTTLNGNAGITGGNLGIGLSNPSSRLEVQGNLVLSSPDGGDALWMAIDKGNDGSEEYRMGRIAGNDLGLESPDTINLRQPASIGGGFSDPVNTLDVDGSAAIGSGYFSSDSAPTDGLIVEGDVGIGTSSPSSALQVNGSGTSYTQIDTNETDLSSTDCDEEGERGRMVMDGSSTTLWVCAGVSGWVGK